MPLKTMMLTAVAWLLTTTLHCQPLFSDIAITSITPANGLSQASNYFRHEDRLGFMWATGNDALNRYDGTSIKVYNLDKYFINCPALQQGYGFAEDTSGNLYIGSIEGLYIYHRRKDRFTLQKIFTDAGNNEAIPFACKDNKVWCFNRYYQLATYDIHTKAVEQVTRLPLDTIGSLHIYGMKTSPFYYRMPFMDERGAIWAVDINKIIAYDTHTRMLTEPFKVFLQQYKNIQIICCGYKAERLICGTTNGILLLNLSQGNGSHITQVAGQQLGDIQSIACYDSVLAFRCNNIRVALLSNDCKKIQWIDRLTKIQLQKAYNFSFDRSGRLWMCIDGVELLVLDFSGRLLHKEPGNRLPATHPLSTGSLTFAELPDGNIIIRGAYQFNKQHNKITTLPINLPTTRDALRSYSDPYQKGIWLFYDSPLKEDVKQQRQIYFYSTQRLTTIPVQYALQNPKSRQQDMVVLSGGRILCSFGEGLFWWHPDTRRFIKAHGAIEMNAFKINVLSNNRVAVSYLYGDMRVYQVLANNNLQLLQIVLPGVAAYYLQEDSLHKRYRAGTNQGVCLLDEKMQLLKQFNASNGLAGTNIYGILSDDKGNAYCSHQRGLSYINQYSGQIINFGIEDGIQDFDFHNRSFLKASDGTLFFGGTKGFNWFKPPLQFKPFYQPEVYVDELLVNTRCAVKKMV